MSAYTKVPMARLAPLIEQWLKDTGNSQEQLALRSGVPARRIYVIRKGYDAQTKRGKESKWSNVTFETADKLLTAMDMQGEWYMSLYDIFDYDDAA